MNKEVRRRDYDDEFKTQAVALVQSGGKTIKQIAEDLGMPAKTLARWHQHQVKLNPILPVLGSGTSDQAQILALKAQLKDVALERDILKKALAICSQWKAQGKLDSNW